MLEFNKQLDLKVICCTFEKMWRFTSSIHTPNLEVNKGSHQVSGVRQVLALQQTLTEMSAITTSSMTVCSHQDWRAWSLSPFSWPSTAPAGHWSWVSSGQWPSLCQHVLTFQHSNTTVRLPHSLGLWLTDYHDSCCHHANVWASTHTPTTLICSTHLHTQSFSLTHTHKHIYLLARFW